MKSSQRGFSLVEIMVAMVIGLISMVVVMQVYFVSEGRKRTTTGGADAQANGAIAFYLMGRDVKMAGWGIDSATYSGCDRVYTYCDGSPGCGGAAGALSTFRFASLTITDGVKGPDSLRIQYFANPNQDTYRFPSTTVVTATMPQSSAELNVASVAGCKENDMVLVSDSGNCTLMQVTAVQGPALKIQHNPGGNAIFNPTINYQKDNNWPAYSRGAALSCFSPPTAGAMFQRDYSISAVHQLQRSDNTVTPAVTDEVVSPDIIDMQAEYGTAQPNSQVRDEWHSAAAAPWKDPSLADWKRIKAVRVALVARSNQYEKPNEAGVCTATTDAMVKQWSTWAKFDTTNYPANWRCYRYKIFESVMPLRNVIWAQI